MSVITLICEGNSGHGDQHPNQHLIASRSFCSERVRCCTKKGAKDGKEQEMDPAKDD